MPPPQRFPEDQANINAFLQRGVNAVQRKPFRPLRLLVGLLTAVSVLSLLSLGIARMTGL